MSKVSSKFSNGELAVIISCTSGGGTEKHGLADLLARSFGPDLLSDR